MISIIIPTVEVDKIDVFASSFLNYKPEIFELVIVNQTGREISDFSKKIFSDFDCSYINTDRVYSAPLARNMGAKKAKYEYLLFADDDARILDCSSKQIKCIKDAVSEGNDVIVFDKGREVNNRFESYNKSSDNSLTVFNFTNFIVEWNFIITKVLFLKVGRFPYLGPGTKRSAQCGEAFLFFAKAINNNPNIKVLRDIKISHPDLFLTPKPSLKVYGYVYGSSYALGRSFLYFTTIAKVFWFLRFFFSLALDIIKRPGERFPKSNDFPLSKIKIVKVKVNGFFDGVCFKKPRSRL